MHKTNASVIENVVTKELVTMINIKQNTYNTSFFTCTVCPRPRSQCKEKKADVRHVFRVQSHKRLKKCKSSRTEDLINEELIVGEDLANIEFNFLINNDFFKNYLIVCLHWMQVTK